MYEKMRKEVSRSMLKIKGAIERKSASYINSNDGETLRRSEYGDEREN